MWVFYTNIGYFLFALSSLVDRFLLLGPLPQSELYAFYVAALGIFSLVLIPFGFSVPALFIILIAVVSGFLSIIALWAWYEAILRSEVSRVVPAGGALQTIFVLFFNIIFFGQRAVFSFEHWVPYIFFLAGGFLLTYSGKAHPTEKSESGRIFLFVAVAAVLFSLTFVLTKYLLEEISFVNMIVWTRVGTLFSIPLLIYAGALNIWSYSREQWTKLSLKAISVVIGVQAVSVIGGILILYAISIASIVQIPLINAMLGTQFIFLYLMAYILHRTHPQLLQERMEGKELHQKLFGVALLALGFLFTIFL